MKKFLTASFFLLLLTSCGGASNVDKVDEKGYNPAPEQIVEPGGIAESGDTVSSVVVEPQDCVAM